MQCAGHGLPPAALPEVLGKVQRTLLIRVGDVTTLADYFLICTGTSNTHVKTLCDYTEAVLQGLGETLLGRSLILRISSSSPAGVNSSI